MNISNKNHFGNNKMSLTKDIRDNDTQKKLSKDINELINLEEVSGTEAYYSKRYGWTLRKVIS